MNKKATAITLIVMAFVGVIMASAVSAQPTVPKPFAPQPSISWAKIDQGTINFQNNVKNPWDDQKLIYKTYKFRFNNNQVQIYMELYNKLRPNTNYDPDDLRNVIIANAWTINKYTIKSLDKSKSKFRINLIKINTKTYNSKGTLTSTNTKTVWSRFDPVKYYWTNKGSLIRK
jgi:hypothetical protein